MATSESKIPQAIEDYLVAIYVLEREGLTVISAEWQSMSGFRR